MGEAPLIEQYARSPYFESVDDLEAQNLFCDSAERFIKHNRALTRKKFRFFTFKDNTQKFIRMDKVAKWCEKWSLSFLIVRSPVDGFHFHGLAVINPAKKINYLKGFHIRVSVLDDVDPREGPSPPDGPLPIVGRDGYHGHHPIIKRLFGYGPSLFHMELMFEIRNYKCKGAPKESIVAKVRARGYRRKAKWSRDGHINRCLRYLFKNFNESGKIMYDDVRIKLN